MANALENLSVVEIQNVLRKRQSRVNVLQKRREKLLEEIKSIDQEITTITGTESGTIRFKNKFPLQQVICEVLGKHKKGLTLAELTEAIEKTGYQSGSANFKNVVYQNVYKSDLVARDEKSGKYVLA